MGRKKKYFTEEERKAAIKEYKKRWNQKNKERIAEYQTDYRQKNKEKISEWYQNNKEYFSGYWQKNKDKLLEYKKRWHQNNKEKISEKNADYYQKNKEKIVEYRSTPYGRAYYLNEAYKQSDKYYNRGECTLTAQWIVDNIFSKPCHYCGETDWHKLGCDRIDNALPHTQDNVVPCCCECNKKRKTTSYDEFMRTFGKVV